MNLYSSVDMVLMRVLVVHHLQLGAASMPFTKPQELLDAPG